MVSATERRCQQPGHVHPRHGPRHLHTPFHPPCRSERAVPARAARLHGLQGGRGCHSGDSPPQARVLFLKHIQRIPAARSRGLLGLQICRHHRDGGYSRARQWWEGHRGLGWLVRLLLHISRQLSIFGKFVMHPTVGYIYKGTAVLLTHELDAILAIRIAPRKLGRRCQRADADRFQNEA